MSGGLGLFFEPGGRPRGLRAEGGAPGLALVGASGSGSGSNPDIINQEIEISAESKRLPLLMFLYSCSLQRRDEIIEKRPN